MTEILDLLTLPGSAIVAGTMVGLVLLRKGLLTLIGDRNHLKAGAVYNELVDRLRAEIAFLRTELEVERDHHKECLREQSRLQRRIREMSLQRR